MTKNRRNVNSFPDHSKQVRSNIYSNIPYQYPIDTLSLGFLKGFDTPSKRFR